MWFFINLFLKDLLSLMQSKQHTFSTFFSFSKQCVFGANYWKMCVCVNIYYTSFEMKVLIILGWSDFNWIF